MAKNSFWDMVNYVISESDVILEVLDARLIDETRNEEIEDKIKNQNKRLIHVINKIDLADQNIVKSKLKELTNPVFVSSINRLGTTILRNKILEVGSKKEIVVGVLGYPNTGKSSVINAIAGARKARPSPTAGFTKHIQKIRASDRIVLLDTPGVFPFEEKDVVKHALIGSKNPEELKEPDLVAMELIKLLNGKIEKHYGIEICEDFEKTIENIAVKMNKLKKGNIPDIENTARQIIREWQKGIIK